MLAGHFNERVIVSRRSTTARKTTYAQLATDIPAHIQPNDGSADAGQMGRGERTFLMFTHYPVTITDRITDEASREYEVTSVLWETFRGKNHYEAMLRAL